LFLVFVDLFTSFWRILKIPKGLTVYNMILI
jgi:hypothetical protein